MIKAFFTSSHIFSVLKQFGELSEEVLICSMVGCDLVMAAYRICSCCAYVIHNYGICSHVVVCMFVPKFSVD